jgi:Flp pilus assembly protein TadD
MNAQSIRSAISGVVTLLVAIPVAALAMSASEVFDKVGDSVLVVKTFDRQGNPLNQGSGIMLPTGKVATNCHVLKNGERIKIGRKNKLNPATVYAGDLDKDLCLLTVEGVTINPVQVGKTKTLKVGAAVYAVGSPTGLELSLSNGIVSQLRGGVPPVIQTTAAISQGSSGGGLFDAEGQLIGITTFNVKGGQNLNFALPVEWLLDIKPGKRQVTKRASHIDWLAQAIALGEKEDWRGLLDLARQRTRTNPGDATGWSFLGDAYWALDRLVEATEAYKESLRIEPNDYITLRSLGITFIKLGRYANAIKAFRRVVSIRPDDAETWYDIGDTYLSFLDRFTDAEKAYREVLRIMPDDAEAYFKLGLTFGKLKRFEDSINYLHQALRIKPEFPKARYLLTGAYALLANSHLVSGNLEAALEVARELRLYDPEEGDKLYNWIINNN